MTLHPLASDTVSLKDKKEAIKVINSGIVTMNTYVRAVEKKFSNILKRYCLMVNSGSSANLLAFALVKNKLSSFNLKSGDEVLIPSLCWSTSLYPIIQLGLKPVFVDIDINTLNIDLNDLRKKITKKTKCLMLVHALGNCAPMQTLLKILKKKKIILVEDTCEALGSLYNKNLLGTFGDVSTFSFYFSHHITSGEGGLITCKNKKDYEVLLALRSHGWARDIKLHRKQLTNKFNEKFEFVNLGYNLRSTDISAALLINQIPKINKFKNIRLKNYKLLKTGLSKNKNLKENLHFVNSEKNAEASWFGFPLILKKKLSKHRNKIAETLDQNGIQTRPIISGNFTEQPVMKDLGLNFRKGNLTTSSYIHKAGFFIGMSSVPISKQKVKKIVSVFEKVFLSFI